MTFDSINYKMPERSNIQNSIPTAQGVHGRDTTTINNPKNINRSRKVLDNFF